MTKYISPSIHIIAKEHRILFNAVRINTIFSEFTQFIPLSYC